MSSNPQTLGAFLKRNRMVRALSSGDTARLFGISPTYYSRLEHDHEVPSIDLVDVIATQFSLGAAELLTLKLLAGHSSAPQQYLTGATT